MGFFDFMRRDEPQEEVTPPVSDVLLSALLAGEEITREKALTLPAVSGAVDFISNCIASMPVKLYKLKAGKVVEVTDDTRVRCLNGDTGDTLDAFQMKKAMVSDYLLGKGGYAYIERRRNEVVALRYVEDIYVTVLKNFKPIYKSYTINIEGDEFKPWEFIKLLRNTKDGASGVGVTAEVSKALECAYDSILYQLGLVKSGGSKKGFLKSQRKLGQEEINVLKAAWRKMYQDNSENVVVLNNGLEFQEASASSTEMQLNESKRTFEDEVNTIFHIVPNDFELTFKWAIYPIIKAFETALNRDLLLEKEKGKFFFEFDVKEIVRASLSERYNAYKTAKETGFMTLNEIRRAENMEYVEGLDVVNVGLGAVLYDINTHQYYTPNTDTVGDPNDNMQGGEPTAEPTEQAAQADQAIEKLIEDKELDTAFEESGNSAERGMEVRFNPNHDSKGRFSAGHGGGGSVAANPNKDAKLKELEGQLASAKGIFAKSRIQTQIDMVKADFQGTAEEWKAKKAQELEERKKESLARIEEEKRKKAEAEEAKRKQLEEEMQTQPREKVEQFKIIQATNPMMDDYHVGIRKPSDIKTWDEVLKEADDSGDSFAWGDFSRADAEKAMKSGKITIYSSYPIGQGVFVSTSRVQSEQYAGGAGGKVYKKTVPLKDVAWINGDEGQFAHLDD